MFVKIYRDIQDNPLLPIMNKNKEINKKIKNVINEISQVMLCNNEVGDIFYHDSDSYYTHFISATIVKEDGWTYSKKLATISTNRYDDEWIDIKFTPFYNEYKKSYDKLQEIERIKNNIPCGQCVTCGATPNYKYNKDNNVYCCDYCGNIKLL